MCSEFKMCAHRAATLVPIGIKGKLKVFFFQFNETFMKKMEKEFTHSYSTPIQKLKLQVYDYTGLK